MMRSVLIVLTYKYIYFDVHFQHLFYPKCKSGHVVMKKDKPAKMRLVLQLLPECFAIMCSYSMVFYTSSRVNIMSKTFEANRRAVFATTKHWSWSPRICKVLWVDEYVGTYQCKFIQ